MYRLILDAEAHNGKNPVALGPGHWAIDAHGDNGHYCYYFHFSVDADASGEVIVDVGSDPEWRPESDHSFRSHRPETVWISRGRGWEQHAPDTGGPVDRLRIRVPAASGERLTVARMLPCPYSEVTRRLAELASAAGVTVDSLGFSEEGREIPALTLGSGPRRALVLAGQHPAEFGGVRAALGIAHWLLSRAPGAASHREAWTVTFVPVVNPDGNVKGLTGANAYGIDLYRSFDGASSGRMPEPAETAALWRWIAAHSPEVTLNFHCYTHRARTGGFPWEGLYTVPDEAFRCDTARERQRTLDDTMTWETAGLSQSGRFALHVPGALEWQLAEMGIPNVFYEVQDTLGAHHQGRVGVPVFRSALSALA